MKNAKSKEKAVRAIRKIVNAAKELAKAEAIYYNRKARKPKMSPSPTILQGVADAD
jgi:hypothetical protein